jgi:hypothetical protein
MSDICAEKHRRVDDRIDNHETRLNNHGERIDRLEQYRSRAEVQVEQLCKQIKSLVKAMWWAMGLAVSTLLGFFVWYVQNIGKP